MAEVGEDDPLLQKTMLIEHGDLSGKKDVVEIPPETTTMQWVSFCFRIFFSLGLGPKRLSKEQRDAMTNEEKWHDRLSDIFSRENLALASHYWNVGLALNYLSTPIEYYLIAGVIITKYHIYK